MTSVELGQPSFSWKAYIRGGSIGNSEFYTPHFSQLPLQLCCADLWFYVTTQVINELSIVSAFTVLETLQGKRTAF